MLRHFMPCTKSLLVLDHHFWSVEIRRNQFMIESDHKIETLSGSPRQKVEGRKLCARTHKFFNATKN